MPDWILLISNLPGRKQTLRMRLWRGLKATGAASLRDGVYLLPNVGRARIEFEKRAAEIRAANGSTQLLTFDADSPAQQVLFRTFFDRSADYGDFLGRIAMFRRKLTKLNEVTAVRSLERLQRELAQLASNDFFPGASQQQAEGALTDAREALAGRFSTGEPHAVHRRILKRNRKDYRSRTWVTREHLWIDRVCSAWLIRRFIDPKARFLWLKQIRDRPKAAIGFDFDGAEFSHVGAKVTFEVLLHSFSLEQDAGLAALAALVHYLDVGGVPVAEAAGLAAVANGVRVLQKGDDALFEKMSPVLDSLYASYSAQKGKVSG